LLAYDEKWDVIKKKHSYIQKPGNLFERIHGLGVHLGNLRKAPIGMTAKPKTFFSIVGTASAEQKCFYIAKE
jgi:hypothetical protein